MASRGDQAPLTWHRAALPAAPPEDGAEVGVVQSDADSEETLRVASPRSEDSEDFLRDLPERPDDEYEEDLGRARLPTSLRELLEEAEEEESSQVSQGGGARLPPPPEELQVNQEFALEEEEDYPEDTEVDVTTQVHEGSDPLPGLDVIVDGPGAGPIEEARDRAESRESIASALKRRAKAFARGRAGAERTSGTSEKKKKKKKKDSTAPPTLPKSPSRLSEMSSASFIFDDDEEVSGRSKMNHSFNCCSRRRLHCSLSCLSFQLYVAFVGLSILFAIFSWHHVAEMQLGAFDLWTQVNLLQAQQSHYFAWARRSALALRRILPTASVNVTGSYTWHTLELNWQIGASQAQREQDFQPLVISDAYVSEVHAAETSLQQLSGWASLCNATPAEVQFLCRPGDSLAALAFGTWETPSFADQLQGVRSKVQFDGQGRGTQIPVETLLAFAREVEPALLERWLPQDSAGSTDLAARHLLRSTFAFYLPQEELPTFRRLVDEELRPQLLRLQDASESESGGLRAFYRVDGRDFNDLPRYFLHGELTLAPPLVVLLSVQLVTRRVLLSIGAAAVLSVAISISEEQVPVAVLAWHFLALTVVEIAIAYSSVISYNRVLMRPELIPKALGPQRLKETFFGWRSPWRDSWLAWLQMPLQLFAPTLAVVVLLQVIDSAASDVPMVQEFAGRALLGSIAVLLLGPLVFLPAVLVGDVLAERRLFDAEGLALLLPKEMAFTPPTAAQRRQRRRYALFAVMRFDFWLMCPSLLVASLILLIVVVASNQVVLDAETPSLFGSGHIFHVAEDVKAHFGGLPSPSILADTALRSASSCQLSAVASAACSWYSCTADTEVQDLGEGLCDCDFRLVPASGGRCAASARFAGLETPPEGFWDWANETLAEQSTSATSRARLSLVGASAEEAEVFDVPPLELEDWSSGQNFLQKQIVSRLPSVPEAQCFDAQCYCDRDRCKLSASASWEPLGRIRAASAAPNDTEPADDNETASTEVFIVWGQEAGSEMNLADPQAQRNLLATCLGTAPDLAILSRRCFAVDFKNWLEANGKRFPTEPEEFPQLLESFAEHSSLEKYFWYETNVGLSGTFATFSVPLAAQSPMETRRSWEEYLQLRSGPLPTTPWLAVSQPLQVDPVATLQDLARSIALLFAPFFGLGMCLVSCSVTLGLAAALAVVLGLCALLACAPMGPQAGAPELLCLVLFCAGSVAPIARFLLFYSSARNGPGKRLKSEASDVFDVPMAQVPSQAQESIQRSERNRFQSMASSEDQQLQEARQRWAQVAAERKELQSLFRAPAVASERRNRAMTALRHSAEILFGFVLAAFLCWIPLFALAPEALAKVARTFLALGLILPAVTLCALPVLILGGLGSSRVWNQALAAFLCATSGLSKQLGGPACSIPELRADKDDQEEVKRASKVLGWPFNRIGQRWLERQEGPEASRRPD